MVAVTVDVPNGNAQFYDLIVGKLFPEGKLPKGWQVHIAGPTEGGWRIVNVVPSQEEFEAFAREQLRPSRGGRNARVDVLSRAQTDPGMSALETQPARANGEFAIGGPAQPASWGAQVFAMRDDTKSDVHLSVL